MPPATILEVVLFVVNLAVEAPYPSHKLCLLRSRTASQFLLEVLFFGFEPRDLIGYLSALSRQVLGFHSGDDSQ
jgi:hypothetical protein